jgi:hypothetical protein
MKNLLYFFIIASLLSCSSEPEPIQEPETPIVNQNKNLILDSFEDERFVLYGRSDIGFMVAFSTEMDGEELEFEEIVGDFPNILRDSDGNTWNVFGKAVSGPKEGRRLSQMNGTMGFFFSFAAFFPEVSSFSFGPGQIIPQKESPDWTVDRGFVFFGATKDGIPSIDQPKFNTFIAAKSDIQYLDYSD